MKLSEHEAECPRCTELRHGISDAAILLKTQRAALDAERSARERAEMYRSTWETRAERLGAEVVAAESALSAEREAHAETKASLGVWIDGLNKAASRLEAAEECLREIVRWDSADEPPSHTDLPLDSCPSCIARTALGRIKDGL